VQTQLPSKRTCRPLDYCDWKNYQIPATHSLPCFQRDSGWRAVADAVADCEGDTASDSSSDRDARGAGSRIAVDANNNAPAEAPHPAQMHQSSAPTSPYAAADGAHNSDDPAHDTATANTADSNSDSDSDGGGLLIVKKRGALDDLPGEQARSEDITPQNGKKRKRLRIRPDRVSGGRVIFDEEGRQLAPLEALGLANGCEPSILLRELRE
jgi:hypothetical protein